MSAELLAPTPISRRTVFLATPAVPSARSKHAPLRTPGARIETLCARRDRKLVQSVIDFYAARFSSPAPQQQATGSGGASGGDGRASGGGAVAAAAGAAQPVTLVLHGQRASDGLRFSWGPSAGKCKVRFHPPATSAPSPLPWGCAGAQPSSLLMNAGGCLFC